MTMQDWWWTADGALLAIAVIAGVADWRRLRRSRIDDWGWMPWRGVQVTALFAAFGLAFLLVRGG